MPVLETLFTELQRVRTAGAPFADAWSPGTIAALAGAAPGEVEDWRSVLVATQRTWQAAYDRAPATRGEVAAGMLAHRDPGVPLEQDACRGCGRLLAPVVSGRRREWCTGHCAQRHRHAVV